MRSWYAGSGASSGNTTVTVRPWGTSVEWRSRAPSGPVGSIVHPVVVGSGGKLFEDGGGQFALKLADTQAYENGVVSLTYRPANRGD